MALVEEEFAQTQLAVDELEAARARLVSEVVSPIAEAVNTTFGRHQADIAKLQHQTTSMIHRSASADFLESYSMIRKAQPQDVPPKLLKGRK